MKVNGVTAKQEGLTYGPLVYDRGDDQLVFIVQPVWSFDEFEELVPVPENDAVIFTDKGKETDWDAPAWKDKKAAYARKRWGWFILKALEPSNVEFDTIDLEDPSTYSKVEEELKANLLPVEFNELMATIDRASSLDAQKLEENRESFLRRQARRTEESTQSGEASSTQSSEPA